MPELPKEPPSSEITPEKEYRARREWLQKMGIVAGTATLIGGGLHLLTNRSRTVPAPAAPPDGGAETAALKQRLEVLEQRLAAKDGEPAKPAATETKPRVNYDTDEKKTPYEDVTTYNNFYEFGTDKSQPALNAHTLKPRPWTIQVEGEAKAQTLDMDQLIKWFTLEDRVYRFRCVEAWSMVIPWQGFMLADLIKKLEPTSKAKYVQFETLHDVEQMPGQRYPSLKWPYLEGLRMDEAMHPLTLMATGLYGKTLPNQNGAPLRLVVPWKYGFKYIKSIVKIRFTEKEPVTSWKRSAPHEYGFYANVNPAVDHPRWSQASERRIGSGSFFRQATKPFNGYADHVAELYKGMDLTEFY